MTTKEGIELEDEENSNTFSAEAARNDSILEEMKKLKKFINSGRNNCKIGRSSGKMSDELAEIREDLDKFRSSTDPSQYSGNEEFPTVLADIRRSSGSGGEDFEFLKTLGKTSSRAKNRRNSTKCKLPSAISMGGFLDYVETLPKKAEKIVEEQSNYLNALRAKPVYEPKEFPAVKRI
ncbi:Hypothetical protein NTJ_10248 [Nesidiocoris tenuis]|uniref:Uncharacterized protein n=1 Tax=Nesidiocoris tenuis TaxID=355587 RepID=A0ABN7AZ40_9HEMI|nr:Hypothetical protein NTJ_10248 [Nesidiocoris tenuis]